MDSETALKACENCIALAAGKFSWFQSGYAYGVWNGLLATYTMRKQVRCPAMLFLVVSCAYVAGHAHAAPCMQGACPVSDVVCVKWT
jgi:hypothetical protein